MDCHDPTLATLRRIVGGDQFVRIPGVPVFDAHEERDDTGKIVRAFGRQDLEEIAAATNRRERETGDLALFGAGHTVPNVYDAAGRLLRATPEHEQPEPWGCYQNFRVGTFGPAAKLGLLADMLVRKDKQREALSYPRRSIELWARDKTIDWVAHLRRAPRRDLGMLFYDRRGEKLVYEMNADLPNNPTTPPDATAPDAAMIDKIVAVVMAKIAAMGAGGTPPVPAPSMPPAPVPLAGEEKERMQREQHALQAARYERENKDLRDRLALIERSERVARYERDLSQLVAQGYAFDLAEEVAEVQDLDANAFARHKDRIVKRYARAPLGDFLVRPTATRTPGGSDNDFTERDLQTALCYQRDNAHEFDGLSPEAAWAKAKKIACERRVLGGGK